MQSILDVTFYSACSANYLMMIMGSQVYKMFCMNQFYFKKLSYNFFFFSILYQL